MTKMKAFLLENGLTMTAIANAVKCTRPLISAKVNERVTNWSYAEIKFIAEQTNTNMGYFAEIIPADTKKLGKVKKL